MKKALHLAIVSTLLAGQPATVPAMEFIEPNKTTGSSAAVIVDERVPLAHTAQLFPINRRGRLVAATNVVRQATAVLENLDTVLKSAGSSLDQTVKLYVYLAPGQAMSRVHLGLDKGFTA